MLPKSPKKGVHESILEKGQRRKPMKHLNRDRPSGFKEKYILVKHRESRVKYTYQNTSFCW